MQLPKFEYFAPTSKDEFLSLINRYGEEARLLAGGTDLLVAAKLGTMRPRFVISLRKMKALRGMTYDEDKGLRIGATTTLYQIARNSTVHQTYPALSQAAALVASPQLQRVGTIGGNVCLNTRCNYFNQTGSWREQRQVCFKMGGDICHVVPKGKKCFALFSADTPPILLAYGAQLSLLGSKGERSVPIKAFYTRNGKEPNALHSGEVLLDIQLPPPAKRQIGIYLKYRKRGSIDFPLVGVAASIVPDRKGDKCKEAKVILNAVGPGPVQVNGAETCLKGSALSKEAITEAAGLAYKAAHPMANADSTPEYRRDMARIFTKRALEELSMRMKIQSTKCDKG